MTITVDYKNNQENINVSSSFNRYVEAFDWYSGETYVIPQAYATQSKRTHEWYVLDGLKTAFLEQIAL